MALKPEAMQRVLIVASKGQQTPVIETLHSLRAAHFIEFQETRDGEFSEFRMGTPLPAAAAASERLVRVRALTRHLALEDAVAEKPTSARELETRLDAQLDAIEAEVSRVVATRESVRNDLTEGRDLEALLLPLTTLPLKLEDYAGYETLAVFVGRADAAYQSELARVARDHMLVTSEGGLFALFVPQANAQETSELLYRHGFAEVEVPQGKGLPADRVKEIQAERATLEGRLAKANADLARLSGEHKDFLLAAEEHLAIQVEKAEAPLAFASTENAFVVDAWIPISGVSRVEAALQKATRDGVHFARLETSADVHHDEANHHDHNDGGADAAYAAHPAAKAPIALPPTKYDNARGTRRFEWFTELFSTPRYDEIDPTTIFAIFFPVFFGFMIGDLGLGLVMVLLGWLLMTKLPRVDGMKQLGTAILIAGIIGAALGGFVFKDALGIPLGVNGEIFEHTEHALVEEAHESGASAEILVTCMDVYKHAHEATWSCIVGGGDHVVHHESWSDPLLHKVTDVPSMLLLSIMAGLVHLLVGLLFGIRNEWGHGGKHLAAKFGYLILLLAFFPAALALLRGDLFDGFTGEHPHTAIAPHIPITSAQAYMITGIGVLLGAVILGWAEGVGGILEIPSMFGAIMSYLRLGAVAIAKGAMAIAFNSFTLVVALTGAGAATLILGTLGFLVAQLVLLVLGLLSGGIQALRLNFVEFFTKFYKGGGTRYKPFGRERRYTATPASAAATSLVTITGLQKEP